MRRLLLSLLLAAGCVPAAPRPDPARPVTVGVAETGTSALLVSVDAAPGASGTEVLWTSGTGGTWGRSLDGGRTWTMGVVPGADALQFRDVEAFSADEAVLLSIGNGTDSRLYTTADGGATWTLRWTNDEAEAFYDCLAFFDRRHGFAFSDAVGTRLPMVETRDGGASWLPVPASRVPAARPGEGSYASSGTCAVADGARAWIVTNGGDGPDRVFRTRDRGATWQAVETPVHSDDDSRGLATLAVAPEEMRAGLLGAVDGVTLLRSGDAGATWELDGATTLTHVYGLAAVREGRTTAGYVAVGPEGVSAQRSGGAWHALTDAEMWGVVGLGGGRAVAVGRDGRVAVIRF